MGFLWLIKHTWISH